MSIARNLFEKRLAKKLKQHGLSEEEGVRIYNHILVCLDNYLRTEVHSHDLTQEKLIFKIPFLGRVMTKYKDNTKQKKIQEQETKKKIKKLNKVNNNNDVK